jgi:hypothetical protein
MKIRRQVEAAATAIAEVSRQRDGRTETVTSSETSTVFNKTA